MGSVVTIASGRIVARVDQATGLLSLTGPDRAGNGAGLHLSFAPMRVKLASGDSSFGAVVSSSSSPTELIVSHSLGGSTVKSRLSFPFDSVARFEVIDWAGLKPVAASISVLADADEHFYGFGEKYNALDQAGHQVDVLTFDNPGNKGDRSYKVAPWFISNRGYGFHLDSTAQCAFDMRVAATHQYTVTNQIGVLTFNIVFGPSLIDVLSRYTGYTGRPPLPPPWAFGPWISSDIWRDGGEVRYAVEQFRARKIPVSGFVFDSPWEVAYNDFKFNIGAPETTQFGHAGTFEDKAFAGFATVSEMMTFFARNGLKAICWMTPFVNVVSTDEHVRGQNLGEAQPDNKQDSFFVRDGDTGQALVVPWWKGRGSPIDFTQPAARDWLSQRLKDLVASSTVSTRSGTEPAIGGFKTDDGESGNGTNTYIPPQAKYAGGQSGRDFVNGYCREYHRTVYGVLGQKGILFARSGFAGTQAFPGCWAGDNEPNFGVENGLPAVIVAGLSAAMSGFSIWGHDVGGYLNSNFSHISPADLFIRWAQFGCFSPIMQMHRQVDSSNLRQYPWGYPEAGETVADNRALRNYRFYTQLHTRLFPYIYTFAKQSAESGVPIIRPLVLIHPDDPKTIQIQHTYYFGSDLIVAPVIEPMAQGRTAYLPAGDWFDFWTNERHTGGQDVNWTNPTAPAEPASKIPVFVRSGGIVPLLLEKDVETLCDADYVNNPAIRTWQNGLELRIYPAADSQMTLYDNTSIRCTSSATETQVSIASQPARLILLRMPGKRPTAGVRRNNTALAEVADEATFDATSAAWRFDPASATLVVKFDSSAGVVDQVIF